MMVERSQTGKEIKIERNSPRTNSPEIRKAMAANRLGGRIRKASQAKARIPAITAGGIINQSKIADLKLKVVPA
jgi:hypothetical protein